MCRFYGRGEKCPYDLDCNYAHGKNQLKARDCPLSENSSAQKPSSLKTKSRLDAFSAGIAKELFPREGKSSARGQAMQKQAAADSSLEERKHCAAPARNSVGETSLKMQLSRELAAGLLSAA